MVENQTVSGVTGRQPLEYVFLIDLVGKDLNF